MNKEKTTISGNLLEFESYPESKARDFSYRGRKENESSEEQKAHNKQLSRKKVVRLVNANFEKDDYFVTLTFDAENAPEDYAAAHRLVDNCLRRIKRRAEKAVNDAKSKMVLLKQELEIDPSNVGLTAALEELQKIDRPLKYLYVISDGVYASGKLVQKDSYHVHMFITAVLARSVMEELWKYGTITRFARFDPERYGPEGAALYVADNKLEKRRVSHSKNFNVPIEEKGERRVSVFEVADMCEKRVDDKTYWENRFPGYGFVRTVSRFNSRYATWHLRVVLYKYE